MLATDSLIERIWRYLLATGEATDEMAALLAECASEEQPA